MKLEPMTDDELTLLFADKIGFGDSDLQEVNRGDLVSISRAIEAGLLAQWQAAIAEQPVHAYAVYFPDQPCEELVHDLDELLDDMTNREHTVTPLFATEASKPVQAEAPSFDLIEAVDTLLDTAPCDCSDKRRFEKGEHLSHCYLFDLNVSRLATKQAEAPHSALMKFYGVDNLSALVEAQHRHIEKLQAKLPRNDQPAFTRIREG